MKLEFINIYLNQTSHHNDLCAYYSLFISEVKHNFAPKMRAGLAPQYTRILQAFYQFGTYLE